MPDELASEAGTRRLIGVQAQGMTACPCAQILVQARSRERLLDAVWGHDSDIESRTVDVHIRRLRKAINVGDRPDIIRTVRSAGYALDSEG